MTIYSWNMLYRNRELDRAFEFISHADFDIFCLQDVPEPFLSQLKTLPSQIAYRMDSEKMFPRAIVPMYNVILSRHAITGQNEMPFDEYWLRLPLFARFFALAMRPFHFAPLRNRGGIYADVSANGRTLRIFNLHLALAFPAQRMREFELAMAEHDPVQPTIVCGDFNILEKPHISILNWLMGGRMSDALFFKRERMHIEQRFVEHSLVNPLRGSATHALSRSQLDHILVSHSLVLRNAEVLAETLGSDHHPIRVDIL
jgi:endonuclease/exonuclease/phosphatase family metal-dependent hydrolase